MKDETIDTIVDVIWALLFVLIIITFSSLLLYKVITLSEDIPQTETTNNLQVKKVWRIKEVKKEDGTTDWIPVLVDEDDFVKTA